jgi:hypothetical protein
MLSPATVIAQDYWLMYKKMLAATHDKANHAQALKMAKKLVESKWNSTPKRNELASIITVLTKYPKCQGEPAELFFKGNSEHANSLRPDGMLRDERREYWKRQHDLRVESLTRLTTEFPGCELVPTALYLLACTHIRGVHYSHSDEEKTSLLKLALSAHQKIVAEHPRARFPVFKQAAFEKGGLIAAHAQFAIAGLLKQTEPAGFPQNAIAAYKEVLKQYAPEKTWTGTAFGIAAYLKIIHIHTEQFRVSSAEDRRRIHRNEVKRISRLLLDKYPNQRFRTGFIGELHPEALMCLARVEDDFDRKERILWRILANHPKAVHGSGNNCAVSAYSVNALHEMLKRTTHMDAQAMILNKVIESKLPRIIRCQAMGIQVGILDQHREPEKALKLARRMSRQCRRLDRDIHATQEQEDEQLDAAVRYFEQRLNIEQDD